MACLVVLMHKVTGGTPVACMTCTTENCHWNSINSPSKQIYCTCIYCFKVNYWCISFIFYIHIWRKRKTIFCNDTTVTACAWKMSTVSKKSTVNMCALVKEKGEVCNKTGGTDNCTHNHTQI